MSFPMNVDSPPTDSNRYNHDPEKFNNDVIFAIEECQKNNPGSFRLPQTLFNEDPSYLLRILLEILHKECQMDNATCSLYLHQHQDLHFAIYLAYQNKTFANLLGHPNLLSQAAIVEHTSMPVAGLSSGSHQSLGSISEPRYHGKAAEIFINTLNRERNAYSQNTEINKPYNWAISVIQSSGMGKTRMVEEAAKTVFTLPINLREDLLHHEKTCPPPDVNVRGYFMKRQNDSDIQQQADYAIFLLALFIKARESIESLFPGLTGTKLARAWADHLAEGQTESGVGFHRKSFYDNVVQVAEKASQNNKKTLGHLKHSMRQNCQMLQDLIQPTASEKNACFVYFDEAHSLCRDDESPHDSKQRSPYHNLGIVLSELTKYRVFFIFLSANSRTKTLDMPLTVHPSALVVKGARHIPPFTELPLDVFEYKVLEDFRSLTLEKVGETATMVNFGRPMWHVQYQMEAGGAESVFKVATAKLASSPADESDAVLAALGVRVGIAFDETYSHSVQSRLVESNLRVVYSIPGHGEYLHTGAPSEPVLAEAAARYLALDGRKGIAVEGPPRLAAALEQGILAREERVELVGRLLVTAAHDISLRNYYKERGLKPASGQPQFHRPVPVMDFLCALFHEKHHDEIRSAQSITGRGVPLDNAFAGSYVFFTHFALAKDSEILTPFGLATALVRGMALQVKDDQISFDAAIPIHMGRMRSSILPKSTSAINLQFKNRKDMSNVNRLITAPGKHRPVISIIFELGTKGKLADTIEISTIQTRKTRRVKTDPHFDDHHYEIVVRGCSPAVFGVISPQTKGMYAAMLGTGTVLEDFPRQDEKENLDAFWAVKPAFDGQDQQLLYGRGWDPTTGGMLPDYEPAKSPSLRSDDGISDNGILESTRPVDRSQKGTKGQQKPGRSARGRKKQNGARAQRT
ncbi:unnamed protein product [Rhizoctonia solani]|nr:unnamed protein product [Rhizoctonia solani]